MTAVYSDAFNALRQKPEWQSIHYRDIRYKLHCHKDDGSIYTHEYIVIDERQVDEIVAELIKVPSIVRVEPERIGPWPEFADMTSGTFWVEETYPPIGGGSQELDTQYNGWTNYATWRVNLELLDGERENWLDAHAGDDPDNLDLDNLTTYLDTYVDDVLTQYGELKDCIALDYARSFVSDANFHEIAETFLANLKERNDYDAS